MGIYDGIVQRRGVGISEIVMDLCRGGVRLSEMPIQASTVRHNATAITGGCDWLQGKASLDPVTLTSDG